MLAVNPPKSLQRINLAIQKWQESIGFSLPRWVMPIGKPIWIQQHSTDGLMAGEIQSIPSSKGVYGACAHTFTNCSKNLFDAKSSVGAAVGVTYTRLSLEIVGDVANSSQIYPFRKGSCHGCRSHSWEPWNPRDYRPNRYDKAVDRDGTSIWSRSKNSDSKDSVFAGLRENFIWEKGRSDGPSRQTPIAWQRAKTPRPSTVS